MKQNCWEYKNCSRRACPVHTERRLDRVHDGANAGRACWVVAGTLCGGKAQGVFAQKMHNCKNCEFYKLVQEEEGPEFEFSNSLLARLN